MPVTPPGPVHQILVLVAPFVESQQDGEIGTPFLRNYLVHLFPGMPFAPIAHNKNLRRNTVEIFREPVEIDGFC